MNNTPCKNCVFYEPQVIYNNNVKGAADHGWCAKKSIYPLKEEYAQAFPSDVQRGELPKPVIVWAEKVVPNCTDILVK